MKLTRKVACPYCAGKGTIEVPDPEALRVARERAGLSQAQMAARCGVSPGRIGDIEQGRPGKTCPPRILKEYARLRPKAESK